MAPPRLTDLAKTTLKIVAAILIVSFVAIPIGFALEHEQHRRPSRPPSSLQSPASSWSCASDG